MIKVHEFDRELGLQDSIDGSFVHHLFRHAVDCAVFEFLAQIAPGVSSIIQGITTVKAQKEAKNVMIGAPVDGFHEGIEKIIPEG